MRSFACIVWFLNINLILPYRDCGHISVTLSLAVCQEIVMTVTALLGPERCGWQEPGESCSLSEMNQLICLNVLEESGWGFWFCLPMHKMETASRGREANKQFFPASNSYDRKEGIWGRNRIRNADCQKHVQNKYKIYMNLLRCQKDTRLGKGYKYFIKK